MTNKLLDLIVEFSYFPFINEIPGMLAIKSIKANQANYFWANDNFLDIAGVDGLFQLRKKQDSDLPWKKTHKIMHDEDLLIMRDKKNYLSKYTLNIAGTDVARTYVAYKKVILNDQKMAVAILGNIIDITDMKNQQNNLKLINEISGMECLLDPEKLLF